MAAVHFEDWITRKRSLRPSLWESAYVGYQAVTSVTDRTALGRYVNLSIATPSRHHENRIQHNAQVPRPVFALRELVAASQARRK